MSLINPGIEADEDAIVGDYTVQNVTTLRVSDWKELYMQFFSGQVPSIEDCSAVFSDTLGRRCDVFQETEKLGVDLLLPIDQNIFSEIGDLLVNNSTHLLDSAFRCFATCNRCNKRKPTLTFVTPSSNLIPNCNKCRRAHVKDPSTLTFVYYIIDVDMMRDDCNKLENVMKIHKENFNASRSSGRSLVGLIWSKEDRVPVFDSDTTMSEYEAQCQFLQQISSVEQYRYVRNGGTERRREYEYSQASRRLNSEKDGEIQRVKDRRRIFACRGSIVFCYKEQQFFVRIRHDTHHEGISQYKGLSSLCKTRIGELASSGMAPFQVISVLRTEFETIFVYDDVYNAWSEAMCATFRRDSDPVLSLKKYLIESVNVHPLCEQNNPLGIGFTTELGDDILRK